MFIAFVIAIIFSLVSSLISSGILFAVYTFVLTAIFPTLPALAFWQIYLVMLAISVIGNFFRSSGDSK